MLPSLPQRQITDHTFHSFLRCGLSSISLSLTAPSGTDEKNQNQKGSPTQDEGVKPVDTSKQRDEEDGTAGKSDSSSDQSQPPTETMVSLTTVCVVSAVAQTLHWSHTRVRLTFSLCLSHPLTWCVCLSIFPWQIHMACTHTHTHKISTHPHTLTCTDNICKRKAAETGGLVKLLLSDLSVLVRTGDMCVIYESMNVWRAPILQSCRLNVCPIIQQHSNCSAYNSIKLGKATEICLFCWHDCQPIVLKCSHFRQSNLINKWL